MNCVFEQVFDRVSRDWKGNHKTRCRLLGSNKSQYEGGKWVTPGGLRGMRNLSRAWKARGHRVSPVLSLLTPSSSASRIEAAKCRGHCPKIFKNIRCNVSKFTRASLINSYLWSIRRQFFNTLVTCTDK